MIAADFTEFKRGLKTYLDRVEDNDETLIIKRESGKGMILMSLTEYNSIMETMYLLSSKANASRLYESIAQVKEGEILQPKNLIED